MNSSKANNNLNKLRSYSSVFSSTSFARLLKNDDLSFMDAKIERYDFEKVKSGQISTYYEYIQYIYRKLELNYQNEYLYKNTFINNLLLKKYGVKNTVTINEFRVGNSIADLVMFNGMSKAFEIKTELDSSKRLKGQLADYTKIFNECYIITHESLVEKYSKEDTTTGIISMQKINGNLKLKEIRKAVYNDAVDANTLMRCIRTSEYQNIVQEYFGELPQMSSFNMFNICFEMIQQIPQDELSKLFIQVVKKRKSNTIHLKTYAKELRQLALAMNIDLKKYNELEKQLNQAIKI